MEGGCGWETKKSPRLAGAREKKVKRMNPIHTRRKKGKQGRKKGEEKEKKKKVRIKPRWSFSVPRLSQRCHAHSGCLPK